MDIWQLLMSIILSDVEGQIARNANCTVNGCWNWISVLTSGIPVTSTSSVLVMYLFNSSAVWRILNRHVTDTLNENSFRIMGREIADDK